MTIETNGPTILLADDEEPIRRMAGQILRAYGYTVLEAADGVEALEVAKQHPGPIDLLLTDWCMPRLGGEGLIGRLSDGHPETAILVMSGYLSGDSPCAAAVLPKPFDMQTLLRSVSGALHERVVVVGRQSTTVTRAPVRELENLEPHQA